MRSANVEKRKAVTISYDSFGWWIVLAVSMLLPPVYAITMAYETPYSHQLSEMLVLVLSCIVSVYIGIHVYEMIDCAYLSAARRKSALVVSSDLSSSMVSGNSLHEYEQYIRKINALNRNAYLTEDGTVINAGYCRSSDHVYNVK